MEITAGGDVPPTLRGKTGGGGANGTDHRTLQPQEPWGPSWEGATLHR